MIRTYYEIFGVSRTATGDEIRAAYVALMKKYHPDVLERDTDGAAPEMVALLNRCYAVLRDPHKRAEYDGQLLRRSAVAQPQRSHRRELVKRPRAQARRWAIPLLFVIAASVAAIAQSDRPWASDGGVAAGSLLGWGQGSASTERLARPLSPADIAREARLATSISIDQAVDVSKHCFENARADADPTSMKLCIIFDDAFLYWRQNASNYETLPVYFRDEVIHIRHLNALAMTGGNTEKKLDELREITFRALLAQLTPTQGSPIGSPEGAAKNGFARGS